MWKYGFDVVDVNTAVNSAGAILRGEGAPPSQKSGPSVPPTNAVSKGVYGAMFDFVLVTSLCEVCVAV